MKVPTAGCGGACGDRLCVGGGQLQRVVRLLLLFLVEAFAQRDMPEFARRPLDEFAQVTEVEFGVAEPLDIARLRDVEVFRTGCVRVEDQHVGAVAEQSRLEAQFVGAVDALITGALADLAGRN